MLSWALRSEATKVKEAALQTVVDQSYSLQEHYQRLRSEELQVVDGRDAGTWMLSDL
jgi:cytidylate kinase